MDLIQSYLDMMGQPDQHPFTANSSSLMEHDMDEIIPYVRRQFETTVTYLKSIKERRG